MQRQTQAILAGDDGRVRALRFADGEEIAADLVVMAVGIRPNTELAESCGLHVDRGVVVSDTLQTYDPRIYAVGECVRHRGMAYGLVAPLFEQAKVPPTIWRCMASGATRAASRPPSSGDRHRRVLGWRFRGRRIDRGDHAGRSLGRRLQNW